MKIVKSERGMIIVSILIIVVILSIIGLTIINFSVTNAKATKNIEQDMQSVHVAEMGVIRYKNDLMVKMNDVLTTDIINAIRAIEATNSEIAKSNNTNKKFIPINSETIIEKMISQGTFLNLTKFQLGFDPQMKHLIAGHSNHAYSIEEYPLITTKLPNAIEITMKSKGFSFEDINEISAKFTFDLGKIIEAHLTPGGIVEVANKSADLIEKPVLDLMANDQNLPQSNCNSGWLKNRCTYDYANNFQISGNIQSVEGAFTANVVLQQGDINLANSKLYINPGNLTVGTIANISNTKLHSNGNMVFHNSNNGGFSYSELSAQDIKFGTIAVFNNNKLYVEGNIIFDNINGTSTNLEAKGGINNSTIYSTGTITFENINEGFNNSNIFAGDNVTMKNFNGRANIHNTKIQVKGNLKLGDINTVIQNNSIIWVDGNISAGNVNGNAIDTSSFVCAKGSISNSLLQKALVIGKDAHGNDVSNIQQNVDSFEYCGKGRQMVNETKPSIFNSILTSLEKSIDDAKYSYN